MGGLERNVQLTFLEGKTSLSEQIWRQMRVNPVLAVAPFQI